MMSHQNRPFDDDGDGKRIEHTVLPTQQEWEELATRFEMLRQDHETLRGEHGRMRLAYQRLFKDHLRLIDTAQQGEGPVFLGGVNDP